MFDFGDVRDRVTAENDVVDGDISNVPVELTVYSPEVFDTILIDLPGFIMIPEAYQSPELPEQIQKLNTAYMTDPLNILAVVSSATQDPATSMGLREAQRSDPDHNRCLGVVTKIDLMGKNKEALRRLLKNEVVPLAMGRIGIRCRTQQEQIDNTSFTDVVERERQWIEEESGMATTGECRMGVPLLRRELSRVMIARVCDQLPMIIQQLDDRIVSATHNAGFLERLSKEQNMQTVSKELETLVNQLHPAADSRRDLEENIRLKLFNTVGLVLDKSAKNAFKSRKTFEHTRPTVGKEGGAQLPQAAALLGALDYQPDKRPRNDQIEFRHNIGKFRELLIYGGEGHMDGINANAMRDTRDRGCEIGGVAAFFNHTLPGNPRRARSAWTRGLDDMIDVAVTEHHLVDACFDQFMQSLIEFADTTHGAGRKTAANAEQAELAKMYFKYLLEKIAVRIQEESLISRSSLEMVDRERRPDTLYSWPKRSVSQNLTSGCLAWIRVPSTCACSTRSGRRLMSAWSASA
jgi:hypothetical protein